MAVSVKQILEDAYELIEDEDSWVATDNARDAEGNYCCPTSDEAERFSIIGAIIRIGVKLRADNDTVNHAIRSVQGNVGLGYYTDAHRFSAKNGHAATLELLERTIGRFK